VGQREKWKEKVAISSSRERGAGTSGPLRKISEVGPNSAEKKPAQKKRKKKGTLTERLEERGSSAK